MAGALMSVPVSAAEAPRFAVIGLGYVGLPLAVAFGREQPTVGFDIDPERIAELRAGQDHTLEVEAGELAAARQLEYSSDPARLDECNVYIVTVPTPIDAYEQPDLEPLRSATRLIASHLRAGDLVIYESTVYPGTTEEVCVPLLEQGSGLRFNEDFYCGYSPERVSPGTASAVWRTSARSPRVRHRRWRRWSMRCTAASSTQAPSRRHRCAWPKRPRWSRTSSATSTSLWSTSWR